MRSWCSNKCDSLNMHFWVFSILYLFVCLFKYDRLSACFDTSGILSQCMNVYLYVCVFYFPIYVYVCVLTSLCRCVDIGYSQKSGLVSTRCCHTSLPLLINWLLVADMFGALSSYPVLPLHTCLFFSTHFGNCHFNLFLCEVWTTHKPRYCDNSSYFGHCSFLCFMLPSSCFVYFFPITARKKMLLSR